MGGRKRRNTAKTGDVALYKSRDSANTKKHTEEDQDNMYNDVERYHNAKDDLQDDMLKFNTRNDQNSDDDENGLTRQENVFDLALGDDDSDDDDDDSDDSEDRYRKRTTKKGGSTSYNDSDSDEQTPDSDAGYDYDDDDDSAQDFEIPETDVLNWGKRKKDYYHGDTADLELGQEVEDAELEEEAGREVLETRMKGMTEDDFIIDDEDDDEDDDNDAAKSGAGSKEKEKASTLTSAINAKMQKNLSKLSKREKIKLIEKTHPELLPLITHFREEVIRPCVDETLVVANAMFENKENAEAIGATKAGLQYLVTKAMLQTSTALNVCQYLLIKAEHAKLSNNKNSSTNSYDDDSNNLNDSFFIDEQNENNIKNHPVISRLNELNFLGNKIESDIESKVEGLKDQVEKLVQASSLMIGDDDSESDDRSDEGSLKQPLAAHDKLSTEECLDLEDVTQNDDESSSSSSSEYEEDDLQKHKNVMNEARFSLRTQDDACLSEKDDNSDDAQISRKSKKRRRALPTFTDYGDDEDVDPTILNKASMSLASTINSISQRGKRLATSYAAEVDDDENEERFRRGLELMEHDLGADSDGDDNDDDIEIDDDDDDFYSQIKQKSKAKKEVKKSMYAVAPKYPGMDDEIDGERAVGQMIMKNRGLVAHKSKINRNPRVKKREQYRKAIIRRKGAVREVRTDEGHRYGGEETGIKSGLSRSRKL